MIPFSTRTSPRPLNGASFHPRSDFPSNMATQWFVCARLIQAAANPAAGQRTWRAYLSVTGVPAQGEQPAVATVNARDRIGYGPWHNARGQLIANNIADLHGDVERDRNNIRKPTALNEKGEEVNGVGNQPNQHDMLTGSDSRGVAIPGDPRFTTCNNWTSNAAGGASGA